MSVFLYRCDLIRLRIMKTCAAISFLMKVINSHAKHQNGSLVEASKKICFLKRDAKTRIFFFFCQQAFGFFVEWGEFHCANCCSLSALLTAIPGLAPKDPSTREKPGISSLRSITLPRQWNLSLVRALERFGLYQFTFKALPIGILH